jgi:hypothetical protein
MHNAYFATAPTLPSRAVAEWPNLLMIWPPETGESLRRGPAAMTDAFAIAGPPAPV